MQYLLDTCVLSDFARGQAAVTAHIKGTSPETLAITTVTVMEVEYGLNATLARKLRPVMEAFMRARLCPGIQRGRCPLDRHRAGHPQGKGTAHRRL